MLPKNILYRPEDMEETNEIEEAKSLCEDKLLSIAKTFENPVYEFLVRQRKIATLGMNL